MEEFIMMLHEYTELNIRTQVDCFEVGDNELGNFLMDEMEVIIDLKKDLIEKSKTANFTKADTIAYINSLAELETVRRSFSLLEEKYDTTLQCIQAKKSRLNEYKDGLNLGGVEDGKV